jgi:acyl-CoA dehydrogenase
MDFSFTEAQKDLSVLTRSICTDQLTQARLKAVEAAPARFDLDLWSSLGSSGVLSAAVPASTGGGDFGLLEQCSVLIELGRAVAPVPYASSIVVGATAIAEFGSDEQRASFGTPATAGELVIALAVEEEASFDLSSPATQAVREGSSWRLTGAKTNVAFGVAAGAFLLSAVDDSGAPLVFVVLPSDAGVTVEAQKLTDGGGAARIDLADVVVDASRLLGGVDVLEFVLTRAVVAACAHQVGALERALELTAAYASTRKQFEKEIGSFQAVAQRVADAYIDVEGARLTLWQAAWRVASGLNADAEIATAKFWAADAGHRVAHTAVHIHGGTGIDMDHVVHRYFIAAKANEFALGSATAQLLKLGKLLADSPA